MARSLGETDAEALREVESVTKTLRDEHKVATS
jgi:hypothetical protein